MPQANVDKSENLVRPSRTSKTQLNGPQHNLKFRIYLHSDNS